MTKTMRLCCVLLTVLLTACGGVGTEKNRMEETLYHYGSAMRWGEVEQVLAFHDPETLASRPVTELQLERWRQLRVSGYRTRGREPQPDGTVVQFAEIEFVNRHNQTTFAILDREQWRYDADAKRWWLVSGLPDLDRRR